jgi:hypothetical protein
MTASAVPTDKVLCGVSKPIYWSDKDTAKTVAQIKEFNAVGRALCGWPPAKVAAPISKIAFKQRWLAFHFQELAR